MSDTVTSPEENAQEMQISLAVNAQFIKDLSFENPNPIKQMTSQSTDEPSLSVNVEVGAEHLQDKSFEVTLKVKAHAKRKDETIYLIELAYAGIFTIGGVPDDLLRPVLMVECPRLLFPFARNVVAQTTQESGFSPLFLAPVDFGDLFRQQIMGEMQQAQNQIN